MSMYLRKTLVITLYCLLIFTHSKAQDFIVTAYGANGNDEIDDTESIQAAINACGQSGGGRVYFPRGSFFCGPIFLKSNMVFEVGVGASLQCTSQIQRFYKNGKLPTNEEVSNWKGLHTDFQWINGSLLENVRITGEGKLNGRGPELWWGKQKIRPYTIKITGGKNIVFENLWVEDTPFHTFNFTAIDKLKIQGIHLNNDPLSPNTDAFHITDCKNVLLTALNISTGDDCILTPGSENVVVSNSQFKTPWGFWWPNKKCKNIIVNNCIIEYQFLVKDFREAEDVIISNIIATGPGKLFSSYGGPLKNVLIENVRATGWSQGGWFINGENIRLNNIHITRKKGSGNEFLHNGFDFKNVRGLYLRNVRIDNIEEGAAFYGEDITDLRIDDFEGNGIPSDEAVFQLNQVKGASFENVRSDSPVYLFKARGHNTNNFEIDKGKLPYTFQSEVDKVVVDNLKFQLSAFTASTKLRAHTTTPCKTMVQNLENKAGPLAIELFVDKVLVKRTWIWLKPLEKKEIQLTIPPLYIAKKYQISLNNLVFLENRLNPSSARLDVLEVQVSKWDKIVRKGTNVPVEVLVQNIGSQKADFILDLKDQESFSSKTQLRLEPGEKKWCKLQYTAREAGLKKLTVNNKLETTIKVFEQSLKSDFLHYTFDKPHSDTILDVSGLNNHALLQTNAGGQKPNFISDNSGKALKFDGKSAYLTIPDLLLTYPMTISMWIKAGELTSISTAGRQMIFYTSQDKGNDGYGPEPELHLMRDAGNTYSMWSNLSEKRLDLRTDITDTQKWDFVTIVMDSTSALYINGELKSKMSGISAPNFKDFVDRIYIGRPNVNYLRYFNGYLDEIVFFKEALNAFDVKKLFESYPIRE